MTNPNPNYFVMIPSHILDDSRIDDSTAILFGRIASLSNNKGYCFASDEYLAELTGVKKCEIKRRLRTLEDCNYIRRETQKKGMGWDRKIFPNFNYEGSEQTSRRVHTDPSEGSIWTQEQDKNNNISLSVCFRKKNSFGKIESVSIQKEALIENLRKLNYPIEEIESAIQLAIEQIEKNTKLCISNITTYVKGIIKNQRKEKKENEHKSKRRSKSNTFSGKIPEHYEPSIHWEPEKG